MVLILAVAACTVHLALWPEPVKCRKRVDIFGSDPARRRPYEVSRYPGPPLSLTSRFSRRTSTIMIVPHCSLSIIEKEVEMHVTLK
jgi:hypothetical protein